MRIIETVLCAAFLTGCAPKGNKRWTPSMFTIQYPTLVCFAKIFLLTRSTKSLIWHQKNKLTCQTPIRISGLTPEHSPQ